MAEESLTGISVVDATADMPNRELLTTLSVVEEIVIPNRESLSNISIIEAHKGEEVRNVMCNDSVSLQNQVKQDVVYVSSGFSFVPTQANLPRNQMVS